MRNLWNELRSAVANADPCDDAAAELLYDPATALVRLQLFLLLADTDARRLVCPACGAGEHAGCSRPPRTTPAPFAVCECARHDGKGARNG